jgi:hypothetical protein
MSDKPEIHHTINDGSWLKAFVRYNGEKFGLDVDAAVAEINSAERGFALFSLEKWLGSQPAGLQRQVRTAWRVRNHNLVKNVVSPNAITRRSREQLRDLREKLGLHTLEQTIDFVAHHIDSHIDDVKQELESFHW